MLYASQIVFILLINKLSLHANNNRHLEFVPQRINLMIVMNISSHKCGILTVTAKISSKDYNYDYSLLCHALDPTGITINVNTSKILDGDVN